MWANLTPGGYRDWWQTPAGIGPAWLHLHEMTLSTWAADGLLSVFFAAVGVELKQELAFGALAQIFRVLIGCDCGLASHLC